MDPSSVSRLAAMVHLWRPVWPTFTGQQPFNAGERPWQRSPPELRENWFTSIACGCAAPAAASRLL